MPFGPCAEMQQAASSSTELPTPGSMQRSLLVKMTSDSQLELEFHVMEGGQDLQGLGVMPAWPRSGFAPSHLSLRPPLAAVRTVVETLSRNYSPVF